MKDPMTTIQWDTIHEKLPTEKGDPAKTARKKIWDQFNVNGNPYLSLAEVDKGLLALDLPVIFTNKAVIMRAFQAAKGAHNAPGDKDDIGQDYIERSEFRLLFVYLKSYLELWNLFEDIDSGNDKKINKQEFDSALPTMKAWGINLKDSKASFEEVDTNGGGEIMFDEFAHWAIQKALRVQVVLGPTPSVGKKKTVSSKTSTRKPKASSRPTKKKLSTTGWKKINERLPSSKSEDEKNKRARLWRSFNVNGNPYLSLAEVDKGCRDVLKLPEITNNKRVIMRAFQAAKGVHNTEGINDIGENYIERSEFRLLFVYLKGYLELWRIFEQIDSSKDKKINRDEFQSAVPTLKKWGIAIENVEDTFDEIDANSGGEILFDEFADWSIRKSFAVEFQVDMTPNPIKAKRTVSKEEGTKSSIEKDGDEKTGFDWDTIKEKLPSEKTGEQAVQRKELFARFDPNGNGYLSLAEVEKGCEHIIALPEIYENKPVMMRAFQAAKGVANSSRTDIGGDYIEKSEFRLLLQYLRNYLEIWQIFEEIDTGDDRRISLEEFQSAVPILEGWGVKIEDILESFDEIDANGGGQILFDEFANWSIKKALVLDVEVAPTKARKSDDDSRTASLDDILGDDSDLDENKPAEKKTLDWDNIREKLPTGKSDKQKALRANLFDGFDPNGNGYLSLAEIDRGCELFIGIPEIYENKPVMMRAYQAARKIANNNTIKDAADSRDLGEQYVERSEFRLLLVYLRKYLELWELFDTIDTGGDQRIDVHEFQSALPLLESWGVEIENAETSFVEIDTNDGGQILFDEFSNWAIEKGLELEDNTEWS